MNKAVVFIIFCIASFGVSAQNLDEQYRELKESNETYKSYKVIKETELDAFWKSVQDSLTNVKQELATVDRLTTKQEKELANLNTVIAEKDQQLKEKNYAGTHITVLGIDMLKDTYIIINVVIITLLLLAMGWLFYKFKDNDKVAKKKSNDYEKLETDFENYKRNALEKQMKLRRDLQTARNRIEEIRST